MWPKYTKRVNTASRRKYHYNGDEEVRDFFFRLKKKEERKYMCNWSKTQKVS